MQLNKSRVRDPVCGMYLDPDGAITRTVQGMVFYFCGEECAEKFLGRTGAPAPGTLRPSSSRTDSGPAIFSMRENPKAKAVGEGRSMR